MHFEILVEDASGKALLESALPLILRIHPQEHSWRIISYKGIGKIPPKLKNQSDPAKRLLLDQLPRLISGYGKAYPQGKHDVALIVVVDCDNRPCDKLLKELNSILQGCKLKPKTLFRLAIEECGAWLLGDWKAVKTGYPKAKTSVIEQYVQDSICATWEKLADAIFSGGYAKLSEKPYSEIGATKLEWAKRIGPHLNVDENRSPSFGKLHDGLRRLAGII